jgi:hypothetical protein
VLKDSTEHLQEPEILVTLKEEVHTKEFWATVDLKAYARWQVMKQELKSFP